MPSQYDYVHLLNLMGINKRSLVLHIYRIRSDKRKVENEIFRNGNDSVDVACHLIIIINTGSRSCPAKVRSKCQLKTEGNLNRSLE